MTEISRTTSTGIMQRQKRKRDVITTPKSENTFAEKQREKASAEQLAAEGSLYAVLPKLQFIADFLSVFIGYSLIS